MHVQRVVVVQTATNQVALLHRNAVVLRYPVCDGVGGCGGVGRDEMGIVFLVIGHRSMAVRSDASAERFAHY
jgi:hypothetical protein